LNQSSLPPEKIAKVLEVALYALKQDDLRAKIVAALSDHGLAVFKKLAKSPFPVGADPEREANALTGVYLDVETSGLDLATNGVTQLALLRFRYDEKGIVSIDDEAWAQFRDPGVPIEAEVTAITGITDQMVKGKTIATSDIVNVLDGVSIVVAHNSKFDRQFAEKDFPEAGFDKLPWFCTLEDVDWAARGFPGKGLEMLALKEGWVYDAHNAHADVMAGATLLATTRGSIRPAILELLETGTTNRLRIHAVDAAFEAKDRLKERGYRFDGDGKETGHVKTWWVEIVDTPENADAEKEFLRTVFGRKSEAVLPSYRISPLNRFSLRSRAQRERFPIEAPLVLVAPVTPQPAVQTPAAEPALF
jgi:DNA polymerase-3 subunit epsilon